MTINSVYLDEQHSDSSVCVVEGFPKAKTTENSSLSYNINTAAQSNTFAFPENETSQDNLSMTYNWQSIIVTLVHAKLPESVLISICLFHWIRNM